jgi:cellulose synthase/poly-beta-1,6-N-acetylglucosamine synthase-like glycosyltransferase
MPVFLFIFFLLMVAYAILIDYYHKAWRRMPTFSAAGANPSTVISVVVPMRNEEKNVEGILESLHQQDYPHHLFEVIIVNDNSTDSTWEKLQNIVYPDMSVMPMKLDAGQDTTVSHKKRAISNAIHTARGDLIVTTDADCRFHPAWLRTIAAFYEWQKSKFIAAPVYMRHERGLLTLFQSLDFITLQGITAASVYKRFHSMCNGANLAYEKSAFIEVNGFEGIDSIPTGDDMLLMHKIYMRYPEQVFYLKSKEAIVQTEPEYSWKSFFNQRIRWASKADRYQDRRIIAVLALVYAVNVCFLVLGIASFWKSTWFFFFCMLLLAKILIEFPFVESVARYFGQQRLMWYFPLLQPLHIVYTIIAGWLGRFGSYTWKGRKIKRA